MIYIIVDLEATCWEGKALAPNEIIEIGAVCVDDSNWILGEFDVMVRPSICPILSEFCTQLTSITQADVENAPHFPEALQQFQDWIAQFEDSYWLCSWGFYDKKQFKQDCILHGLDTDWLKNHMSIKHQHPKISDGITARPLGMQGALKLEGFTLDGTHHRGIDDARNMTKIFRKYYGKWQF
jgi:inhibitor of KinA sporulation pathway (predicted exonuclease)